MYQEPVAASLYQAEVTNSMWPTPKAPLAWFLVGKHWLIIGGPGDRQCLQIRRDNGSSILDTAKRVEVYSPRLCDILRDRDAVSRNLTFGPTIYSC